VQELEAKLKDYLGVKHLFFCTNGTIVLQMAMKALDLSKEVITTPFSYVATTNAIIWEGCTPVFVDIDPSDCNIDANKIEAAITPNTQAILATHVYGNPCNVEKIQAIAEKYQLKVIYDGAHAFGASYQGRQILQYGDIATCSFHATKVFHTIEGGCIITNDDDIAQKLMLYRQFGHVGDDYYLTGINAKNSEVHAAMGLCNLKHLPHILSERKRSSDLYSSLLLGSGVVLPQALDTSSYNYAYYPVILPSEAATEAIILGLKAINVIPRRYFYPSLNAISYINQADACPISNDISARVLSLPLFVGLADNDIHRICKVILEVLASGVL
jgi:dTDP-4-amino-4,6-dideoxygalactose transaminase